MLDAQLVVLVDEYLREERLVAQSPVGVVAAGVDVCAVGEQSERVIEVCASVGVVTEVGVDPSGHLVEFGDDAVLLALEHGERDRVGVVRLHEAVLLAFEPVAVGREAREFFGFGGHEPVELVVEHSRECVLLGRRDLDARVVVLDEFLDVLDEHCLARAVGALGVPPGADEVAVDVAVAVIRVGDDEPGAALAAVDGPFEVMAVDLGCRASPGRARVTRSPAVTPPMVLRSAEDVVVPSDWTDLSCWTGSSGMTLISSCTDHGD